MTTYNIHDLALSRGVPEPVREAILSLEAENALLREQNSILEAKLAECERALTIAGKALREAMQ